MAAEAEGTTCWHWIVSKPQDEEEAKKTGETGVKEFKYCPFSYNHDVFTICAEKCKWYLPSDECALIIMLERIWFALKDIHKDLDEIIELQAGES